MLYAIVAVVILVADQWLKYWVSANITLSSGSKELIPSVLDLVNVHNEGAAFSLFDSGNMRWVFVGIAVLIVAALIVLLAKQILTGKFARWCAVFAIAGAVGNCIDRVLFGYVVDMFKLKFVNFAVFNLADAVLVVACLLFIIYLFTGSSGKKNEDGDDNGSKRKAAAREEKDGSDPVAVAGVKSVDALFGEKAKPIVDDDGVRVAPVKVTAKKPEAPLDEDPFWASFKARDAQEQAAAAQQKSPAKAEDDFSLDDILAEFKDN